MLIYEKFVQGTRKLFGSLLNVPTSSDVELTYKDRDGDTVTITPGDSYVDDKNGGIIRTKDNRFIAVYIGDQNVVPGKDFEPVTKVLKSITLTTKGVQKSYHVGDTLNFNKLKVEALFESGETEDVAITDCTVTPAADTPLTTSDDEVVVSYTFGGVTKSDSYDITVAE